ncbi:MAG: hypothetical protein LBS03_03590 [Bacteroidales bacterium]|jgi:hypothetical protein|nr:hypothetical protein [Bacteroidales bacterium]
MALISGGKIIKKNRYAKNCINTAIRRHHRACVSYRQHHSSWEWKTDTSFYFIQNSLLTKPLKKQLFLSIICLYLVVSILILKIIILCIKKALQNAFFMLYVCHHLFFAGAVFCIRLKNTLPLFTV